MLGVMPHKFVTGVGSLTDQEDRKRFGDLGSLHWTYTLKNMLTASFDTDAHFTCYHVPELDRWPLLRKQVLQDLRNAGSDILTSYFVFDWDNPKSIDPQTGEKIDTPWTDALYAQFCQLIDGITDPILKAWSALYTTRHGARIIYVLNKPIPVDRAEQHLVWLIQHFRRNGLPVTQEDSWGIDTQCKDWTRRFRCPHVVRDGVVEVPFTLVLPNEMFIDPDYVGKSDVRTLAKRRTFKRVEQGACPTFDHLQGLMYKTSGGGTHATMTAFHKRAKKALKETDFHDLLFNDVPPSWDVGSRNDNILLMLGVIIPKLIRRCGATVKEIMALAIVPVLTLEHTHGSHPIDHTWNALLDIYEREIDKINVEEEVSSKQATIEVDMLNDMLVGMRQWCGASDLRGEEVLAREFVRSHTFASYASFYYPMNTRGYYESKCLNRDQVIARIRKTYLKNLLETTKEGIKGDRVDVPITYIQNRYTTPVFEVQLKPMGDVEGYIEDLNGKDCALVLSMYKRNEKIVPKYDATVDNWLQALFGDMYLQGCEWISQALAFEEGPICALSLLGEPGAGKKLFAMGLAECLEHPLIATGEDLIYQSSALTKTPFLNINEDWPKSRGGSSPADTFKKLTAGDEITINEKYQPMVHVSNPVRVLLTANDLTLLEHLTKGRDMSIDTRVAIGHRVLHIEIPPGIIPFMNSIGNRATTAKPGARWIDPESGVETSDFILAAHFLWLYHNREISSEPARFLVQGNCSPTDTGNTDVFSEILTNNTRTTHVCHAVHHLLASSNSEEMRNVHVSEDETRLFVTRTGIYNNVKHFQNEKISQAEVLHALGNIMKAKEPEKMNNIDWYEVDLSILNNFVNRQGIAFSKIRNLYENYKKKTFPVKGV